MKKLKPLGAMLAAVVLAVAAPLVGARTLIQNKGSDSLAIAVQGWADAYRQVDPDTGIAVNAGGSGTGIAGYLNGTADIANSSRPMTATEIERARELGREPVEHVVGHDVVAVLVHPDNPSRALDFAQLAGIFGRAGSLATWADLGVTVPGCTDQTIVAVGRHNSSGTYAYFRREVLGKEKYRQGILATRGTRHVVDLVSQTPCAIGYASLAYVTPGVRPVCLSATGSDCVVPSAGTVEDGSYPLARPLYMFTARDTSGPIRRYIDWVLGDAGQCIIARRGYVPLRAVACPD